jgi:hypothetical protein
MAESAVTLKESKSYISLRLPIGETPSVVTDWRTEVYGEPHRGSYVWGNRSKTLLDEDQPCYKLKTCNCFWKSGA